MPRVRQRAKLIHEVLEWYREGEVDERGTSSG
jgi:hypothetical protein